MTTDSAASEDFSEFQDPLENYDPKDYDDRLEQALVEQSASVVQHEPYATIDAEMPISEALDKLASMHVACLLVEKNGKLLGVFSDRDVLNRVALEYEQVKDAPVTDVMTGEPVFVYDSQSAAAALSVMAVSGYRHVPVLDSKQNIVGIISPQRVTGFLQHYL